MLSYMYIHIHIYIYMYMYHTYIIYIYIYIFRNVYLDTLNHVRKCVNFDESICLDIPNGCGLCDDN